MCGILAVSGSKKSLDVLKLETLTLQRLVRHRGPDGSGIHVIDNKDGTSSSIAHERLAIMDPLSGNQPLFSQDRALSLAVNGEIYNFRELREKVGDESKFRTFSDCEPIVHLYEQVSPSSDRAQLCARACAARAPRLTPPLHEQGILTHTAPP